MSCIAMVLILLLAGAADGLMDIGMGCFAGVSAAVLAVAGLLIWADGRNRRERECI